MTQGLSLEAWRSRKQQGEQAILPSGLEVTLRKVGLLELAKRGEIPQTLQPLAEEAMQGKRNLTLAELGEVDRMLNVVVGACLLAPVGLEAEELDFADKMAVFQWANSGSAALTFFRPEQAQPVAAGSPRAKVRPAP